jgi:hypothetical protein
MLNQETVGEAMGELSTRSEDAVVPVEEQSEQATAQWLDAEGSLTSLWVGLTHAQLTHNLEMAQQLLDCRDWHTLGKVQQAYVDASVARLNQTVSRHLEVTGAMMINLLAPRDTKVAA